MRQNSCRLDGQAPPSPAAPDRAQDGGAGVNWGGSSATGAHRTGVSGSHNSAVVWQLGTTHRHRSDRRVKTQAKLAF